LCGQLDPISIVSLGFAALIFNRYQTLLHGTGIVDFNHISLTNQSKAAADKIDPTLFLNFGAGSVTPGVGARVQQMALSGEQIISPDPINMDQCRLPSAEHKMLQR
jgi:hypothetical protein